MSISLKWKLMHKMMNEIRIQCVKTISRRPKRETNDSYSQVVKVMQVVVLVVVVEVVAAAAVTAVIVVVSAVVSVGSNSGNTAASVGSNSGNSSNNSKSVDHINHFYLQRLTIFKRCLERNFPIQGVLRILWSIGKKYIVFGKKWRHFAMADEIFENKFAK